MPGPPPPVPTAPSGAPPMRAVGLRAHAPGSADQRAFEQFVAGAYAGLSRSATLLAGSVTGGEDLLQEALVRTYVAWGRIDHRLAAAYTHRIMVNLCTDWWRRRRWTTTDPADLDAMAGTARSRDRHQSVLDRDEAVRLLRTLSPRERAVVVLRYYVDLPEQQVADTLGCSLGTVKSTASRALHKLAATYAARRE